MKSTVSKPQKSQVTITVEVDESELEKYFDQAAKELSQQVKIAGFRPGKVPRDVLEKQIGAGALRAHALDLALPYFYADAVIQEKVPVVAKPTIKLVTDTPFVFEALVAIMPEVKISGYDKIKVKDEKMEVTEKEVDDLIDYFRKQNAQHQEVDRAAQKGDRVEIDFDGVDPNGDVPLDGTSSKNHPVVLGEGSLIPGFEEQIEGMKVADEKTFELKFPEDYHSKKFQGKPVKFSIKLHRIQEVQLPEVNPEWIKTMIGEEKTVEAFRKDIEENLRTERERQERTKRENAYFDELLKLAEVDIPNALIEEEIDFIIDRTKMDLESKGMAWEQYEKYLEGQNRDLRKDKREQAEKQVKLRLVLHHLYKEEKIEASDAEVEDRVATLSMKYSEADQKKVKDVYRKGSPGFAQVQNSILLEKLLTQFLP